MIDIILLDYEGNEEKFVEGASFYESSQPIAKALINLNNERNKSVFENDKITYDKIDNYQAGKNRFIIRTYVTYLSSNFKTTPYNLFIGEETHNLQSYMPLRDGIYSAVDRSSKAKKEEIASNLLMSK